MHGNASIFAAVDQQEVVVDATQVHHDKYGLARRCPAPVNLFWCVEEESPLNFQRGNWLSLSKSTCPAFGVTSEGSADAAAPYGNLIRQNGDINALQPVCSRTANTFIFCKYP